jgi:murein DD-endopeptidase MepM/ murein hydrolase activator NlpD
MLVEKEYVDGEFLRYGNVVAAEYDGAAGTFRAFRWKVPGKNKAEYFDEKGRSVAKSLLKTPLKFTRISSKFNPNRMHPVLHVRRGHHGVDYAAPPGTPVWAAGTGKIVHRGWSGGAGRMVVIKHDSGMRTLYMHLSKFRKGQRVGQRVRQKTVIGYVGSSGLATGPHLHFGVKKNGRYVDPLQLELERGAPVPDPHRDAFEADTGELVARLADVPVKSPIDELRHALGASGFSAAE